MKRTVHVTYVPDEEIDGELGMIGFVQTEQFKSLNVAFSLDEGRDEKRCLAVGVLNLLSCYVICY